MSQLEELKRQRKELDAKIKELENDTVICGNVKREGRKLSIYLSKNRSIDNNPLKTRWVSICVDEPEAFPEYIQNLISNLQNLYNKIK